MSEPKVEWFSGLGSNSIRIIQRQMLSKDPDINRLLKMGTAVAFKQPVSAQTQKVEDLLFISCRKCLDEISNCRLQGFDVNDVEADSPHLPIWSYLGMVGATLDCFIEGRSDEGQMLLFSCGQLWGELESKFAWQIPATHGAKRLESLAESRDRNNLERANAAAFEHSRWQVAAVTVWRNNARLSKSAVANILAEKYFPAFSASTIRQAIKKPDKAG